jgi:hypothetical protein
MRDNFSKRIKERLAARAGHNCSNPECRATTSGPQLKEGEAVNVGVAAHISGAAARGARYDPSLTSTQRASINNGVWLCQNCAKEVDADERRYTVACLLRWKNEVEQEAHRRIGKAKHPRPGASSAERQVKRDLKLRDEMRRDFLKPAGEYLRRGPVAHPYEKFRHSEAIIRRLGDDSYPDLDDQSIGISSWFKVELFDFYHGGIKVILSIERGVVDQGSFSLSSQQWATIPFASDFDRLRFREVGIWRLGLIPFQNIRHYDLHGDEYYGFPHIYCDFSIKGMPYESFEYAIVGKDEYDWHLKPENRLAEQVVLIRRQHELRDHKVRDEGGSAP